MQVLTPFKALRNRPGGRLSRGFTAIELMVVVAILAILAALAGPSFSDLTDGWRVRGAVEELTNTVYYARSEAIKRGGLITVRKNCATGTNQEWDCGWIVFTDTDGSGSLNGAEVVLQTFPLLTGVDVLHRNNAAFYRVDRWGQINGLGAGSFAVTPKPLGVSSRHASAMCISAGGRIKTIKGAVTC